MTLPTIIGFAGSTLTLAVIVWGGFLLGKDILYPPFLYRALFISWISGFLLFSWAKYTQKLHVKVSIDAVMRELDKVVVEVPDVSEEELARVIGPVKKEEKSPKPKVELSNNKELKIESESEDE
ncbi:hypothetical protein J7L05_11105 [bacterium]|nr:hypothetical protein [bacterium]